MSKKSILALAVTAALGSAVALVTVPAHADTAPTVVRSSDFLTELADVGDSGLVTVGDNGVGVATTVPTTPGQDKAKEYWKVASMPLADAGTPALDWTGTTVKPGKQLYVDLDDNPNTGMYDNQAYHGADAILVGEDVYGADWWASNSATQMVKDHAPSHEGGSGSANHGTLPAWSTAFPHAKIVATGFSLGSGANAASGIITKMTLGATTYEFAGKDATVVATPVTTAPTGVTGTVTGTTVSLNWDAVAGATGYSLYRGGVNVPVGESFTTSGQVAGLQPGTSYTFQVAGHMADGTTGPKSAAVTVTTPPVTLAKVSKISTTTLSTTGVVVLWSVPDNNATSYNVYRNGVLLGTTKGTWMNQTGLKSKTTYSYVVETLGNGGAKAPKSVALSVTTK